MSTNVLAYADRYQSKFAWDKGHREKGYYLPDLTTYKWSWGIKLSLSNKCKEFIYFLKKLI